MLPYLFQQRQVLCRQLGYHGIPDICQSLPAGIIRGQIRIGLMQEQVQICQEFVIAYVSVFKAGDSTEERLQGGGLHLAGACESGKPS